ncbi:MAG TPA: glycosyltransferase family 2 protein [Candidatus Binataceae bacterium]|nr:glycosyltransferase family 2 protein [Candidatus Binataceae bacterium]
MSCSVAISILTYRRPQYLMRAIKSAVVHAGQVAEIVVVDNAAEGEVERMVTANFPQVRYIAAPHNAGCEGRNIALRASAADLVITIDDDVELPVGDCVAEVRAAFSRDQQLACLNFTVTGTDGRVLGRDWCHPRPIADASREFETYFILEGASALDRRKVLEVGGYSAEYFLGHEGVDLGFRLIRRGYRIMHSPQVAVVHHAAAEERPSWRVYYYYTRNGLWNCYRWLPPMTAIGRGIEHAAKMAFFSIRARQFPAYLRGLRDALLGIPAQKRDSLDAGSMERVREIRSHRVPYAGRIQKHLRERIL